jgi:hypothetical protein
MLITGIILPSDGGHGLLNFKSLFFLLSFLCMSLYIFIQYQITERQVKLFIFVLSALTFLFASAFISLMNQQTTPDSLFDQFKLFFITLSVIGMTVFFYYEKLITYSTFLKLLIYANFTYSLCKVLLVILHLLGLIEIWTILDLIGFRYMRMRILGDLSRLQTSVDIVTPFLLFFLLKSKDLTIHFNSNFKWIYLIVSVFSIFLSFSRFLILIASFSLLLYGLTLKWFEIAKGFIGLLLISFVGIAWMGLENLYSIIELRFTSETVMMSDETRLKQVRALLKDFEEYPWLGKGLGSYSKYETRDLMNKHSYEVQWIAFLMQFGSLGLPLLLLPLGFIAYLFLNQPLSRLGLACFLLFILWLLAGFTNPFLISLTSGILYSLFALTALHLRNNRSRNYFSYLT